MENVICGHIDKKYGSLGKCLPCYMRERKKELANKGLCIQCANKPLVTKVFCKDCLSKHNARHKLLKDKVYEAYGGYVCKCCNETEKAFLTLDHVNNDGAQQRRANKLKTNTSRGCGETMYRWLIKNNFPNDIQVLCWNCQWGKRKHGICPHITKEV